ncbi:hypothetical protein L9F63_001024, partial [Diploptera punctata]
DTILSETKRDNRSNKSDIFDLERGKTKKLETTFKNVAKGQENIKCGKSNVEKLYSRKFIDEPLDQINKRNSR